MLARTCCVDGCTDKHKGHGYCNKHLKRIRSHGAPDVLGRSGRPLKGEVPSWAAVHKRLARTLGQASIHACVDCGGAAREWSYDGRDPNQITGPDHGFQMAYSLDMNHYQPRCASCHRKFDNAIRYEHGARPHFEVRISEVTF